MPTIMSVFRYACIVILLAVSTACAQSSKQLYDQALIAGKEGAFKEAHNLLSAARKKEPNRSPLLLAVAIAEQAAGGSISKDAAVSVFESINLGNKGNWDEALSLAIRAHNLAPDSAPVAVHLGTVYANLIQANKEDRYISDAIEAYKSAIKRDPQFGLAYYNLGVAQAARRHWSEAKDHLMKASSLGVPVPKDLLAQIESQIRNLRTNKPARTHELDSGQEKEGGFINGLFGPIVLIATAVRNIFKPSSEGSAEVNNALEITWGRGSGAYRFGFIVGCIILLTLLGKVGNAAKR